MDKKADAWRKSQTKWKIKEVQRNNVHCFIYSQSFFQLFKGHFGLSGAFLRQSTLIYRSSHPKVFCKKGVLRNFIKFTGKHLWQSLLFNKVTGLRPATLLNKRLWHRCFPVNFMKFLRTPFQIEHLWWLLLKFIHQITEKLVCHFFVFKIKLQTKSKTDVSIGSLLFKRLRLGGS